MFFLLGIGLESDNFNTFSRSALSPTASQPQVGHNSLYALLVLRRQHERTPSVKTLLAHVEVARERHVVPDEAELDVLPPKLGALIDETVLHEDGLLPYHLGRVGVLDYPVPEDDLVLRVGRRGVCRDDEDEELLDVPVEGRAHVGLFLGGVVMCVLRRSIF